VGSGLDLSVGPTAAACTGLQEPTISSDLTRLADHIRQLSPENRTCLAKLLSSDRPLVDAIVRHSHFQQIIDLCQRMLAVVVATRLPWVLREELAHRKRQRDRKPDPENRKRNDAIRAEWQRGKSLGQLAKKYDLSRQRIQQLVREKVSSN
jgi:hypothetical protein